MPVPVDKRDAMLSELDRMVTARGIAHPAVLAARPRPHYLEFLDRFGYSLRDVEGPHTGYSESECFEMAEKFLRLLRDDRIDNRYCASMAWPAYSAITGESNFNFLLDSDAALLKNTALKLGSPMPAFEIGIFPMFSSGAEVTKVADQDVVLLDTGLLRILQFFCTVLLGNIPEGDKPEILWRCVDSYVKNKQLIPIDYGELNLEGNEQWGIAIVNEYFAACRKFLIAHEAAHIVFGHHVPYEEVNIGLPDGHRLTIDEKTELSELEADATALNLSLAMAFYNEFQSREDRRRAKLMAIAGPGAVFSLFLIMEFARRHHGVPTSKGHPFASVRIRLLYEIACFYRQHEHCWLAQRATELAHQCCERFYAQEVEAFKKVEVSEVTFKIFENILENINSNPLPTSDNMFD